MNSGGLDHLGYEKIVALQFLSGCGETGGEERLADGSVRVRPA